MPKPIKFHLHGDAPTRTTDHRGDVIEALCERYKPVPQVEPPEVYREWTSKGYTEGIFCGDCLSELRGDICLVLQRRFLWQGDFHEQFEPDNVMR